MEELGHYTHQGACAAVHIPAHTDQSLRSAHPSYLQIHDCPEHVGCRSLLFRGVPMHGAAAPTNGRAAADSPPAYHCTGDSLRKCENPLVFAYEAPPDTKTYPLSLLDWFAVSELVAAAASPADQHPPAPPRPAKALRTAPRRVVLSARVWFANWFLV